MVNGSSGLFLTPLQFPLVPLEGSEPLPGWTEKPNRMGSNAWRLVLLSWSWVQDVVQATSSLWPLSYYVAWGEQLCLGVGAEDSGEPRGAGRAGGIFLLLPRTSSPAHECFLLAGIS